MQAVVTLEGRGEVPCRIVSRHKHTADWSDGMGRSMAVRYVLMRVVLEDGESRLVAAERVRIAGVGPVTGGTRRPPSQRCKRGKSHRVVLGGVTYPSLAAACRATGMGYSTARERVRAGYPPAVAALRWER